MPEKKEKRTDNSLALRVITRGDMLVLLAVIIVLAALANWMFFATIRTSFTETGVLTTAGESIAVHQPVRGVVTEVLVARNDYVKEGKPLLRVCPAEKTAEGLTLREMRAAAVDVPAEVSGYVSEIEVSEWDEVDVSTTLLYILESKTKEISHVSVLIPVTSLDMVSEGTLAKIKVDGIDTADYGILTGSVVGVSEVPWLRSEMIEKTGSAEVADILCREKLEQFHVDILLETDAKGNPMFSGGMTPKGGIICGRMCEVTFYSHEKHPYEVLLLAGR